MKSFMTIAITLTLAFGALAEGLEKGAKSIFVDSTSGTVIAARTSRTVTQKTRSAATPAAPAPVAEVSGLMYYVEVVSAKGEISRATTDRVFRSGERILLHVVSSINGDIAIYQRTPDGRQVKLFPDERIDAGNAYIAKGVDTILPSPTSWFRFDEHPGKEELTIVLTPRVTSAPSAQRPQVASVMAQPRYDDVVTAAGSKGLIIEAETTGRSQATYVVRRTEIGRPPEPIVVAVRLEHR